MNFIFLAGALALVCFPIAFLIDKKVDYKYEWLWIPSFMAGFTGLVALLIMIVICVTVNATAVSDNYKMLETQKALEFKLESADIRDEFGLLNKAFVDEVEEYNKAIVSHKALSESPWVSAFHPKKVIEGCERIDYEKFLKK